MVKKHKTLGTNKLDELIDHYTKLYENERPEYPTNSNYGTHKVSNTWRAITIYWKGKVEHLRQNVS